MLFFFYIYYILEFNIILLIYLDAIDLLSKMLRVKAKEYPPIHLNHM